MGFDVWVAKNDRNKEFNGKKLSEIPKIKKELPLTFDDATNKTIELIDVLWLDGNAKVVSESNQKTTIRLVGIDAPETSKRKNEPGQPFSRKATKYLAQLVLNKSVQVKSYGPDRYGRTLGVVFVDGKDVNLEMINAGLAEVYRGRPVKGQDLKPYWKAEEEARAELRGMWVLKDQYISPRNWRKGNRQQSIFSISNKEVSNMSNLSIAIFAGLLGSIVTAFLSYLVQQRLAKKRREEEEARLAFVYLVKISDILAAEGIIKFLALFFEGLFEKVIKPEIEKLKSDNETYELAHIISAIAAKWIPEMVESEVDQNTKIMLDGLLESNKRIIEGFSIESILLSKMPKEAIISYHSLADFLANLNQTIKHWQLWLETKDESLISAEIINRQWINFSGLLENAKILRKALIKKGRVRKSEADKILREKQKEVTELFGKIISPKAKLKSAEIIADKFLKELKNKKKKDLEPSSE